LKSASFVQPQAQKNSENTDTKMYIVLT
jgi:hypothetical protein